MFTIQKAQWDTEYFGIPCAKAEITGVLSKDAVCDFWEQAAPFRYITVSNPDVYAQNNAALEALPGALQADTNILLKNSAPFPCDMKLSCDMELTLSDCATLEDISTQVCGAFSSSRFYHDPHITPEQADGIYINWLRNAQKKENKYFCVCRIKGAFAGLILFRKDSPDTALIELIFTAATFRKAGVGTAMMQRLFAFCTENSITQILVGTQKRNETALSFYRKNGFQDEAITHIFHIWKD